MQNADLNFFLDGALKVGQDKNKMKILSKFKLRGETLDTLFKYYMGRTMWLRAMLTSNKPLNPEDSETLRASKSITNKKLKIAFDTALANGDVPGQQNVMTRELQRLVAHRIKPLIQIADAGVMWQRGNWP